MMQSLENKNKKVLSISETLYKIINTQWLSVMTPDVLWFRAEQTTVPPNPENINQGYYKIEEYKRLVTNSALLNYDQEADKFNETSTTTYKIKVSLDVVSIDDSAEDILNNTILGFAFQSVREAFLNAGFSPMYCSDPINLSQIVAARWNKRFRIEVFFSCHLSLTDQIDRIVSAPVTGTLN